MSHAHRRRHGYARALLVSLVAVGATACGSARTPAPAAEVPSPAASASPSVLPVTAVGLPQGVDLQVTDASPGAENADNLSFASPVYSLSPAGSLPRPTTITMQLDNALPPGTQVLVVTRSAADQPWSYTPGRLTSDQAHVEFTTRSLGQAGVLAFDVAGALTALEGDVRSGLGAGLDATAQKPTCAGTAAALQDGYSVTAPKAKTLFWCIGLENGKRVLKVTNRKAFPIEVLHPQVPVLQDAVNSKQFAAWPALLGTSSDTFMAPASTATYNAELQPKTGLEITAAAQGANQSVRLLQATVRGLVLRLAGFAAGSADVVKTMSALLARPQCASTFGKGSDAMITGCVSRPKLLKTFGSRGLLLAPLVGSPAFATFLRKQVTTLATVASTATQRIVVRRSAPDFTAFSGAYSGKTRVLTIGGDGVVVERLSDDTGALVVQLTYQLEGPVSKGGTSSASATLTAVTVGNRSGLNGPVPQVGNKGQLTVRKGVVQPPFLKTNYCDAKAAKKGTCAS